MTKLCGRRRESAGPQVALHARGVAVDDSFLWGPLSSLNVVSIEKERCPLWVLLRRFKVREHERGLLFKDREFQGVLRPGRHFVWDLLGNVRADVVSVRDVWLDHRDLDVIARSGALAGEARVLDLKDHERAVVWVDGRVEAVLKPGLYALWTVFHELRVEVFDAHAVRFEHAELAVITQARGAAPLLEAVTVEAGHAGLFFKDGRHEATLAPGAHAFWKGVAKARVLDVDLREQVVDVAGQEIMTADKVTLRLNAVVTFKVVDPLKAVSTVEDYRQALYREAQLALRGVIGTRELDKLLGDKDAVARELDGVVRGRVAAFGVEVAALGIRDVILPGEMKDLMNKVTEAKKAAEAALITRREETAAMRSQANTAKILESSPTLMRLRELEVLEKVSEKANLTVVLGEKGLADRVVKLL
jgi:regulator of protease activity HflC (stomatin/prohibitin superfamily)